MPLAAMIIPGKAKEKEGYSDEIENPDSEEYVGAAKDFYMYSRRGMWEKAAEALQFFVTACMDKEKETE